MNKVISRNGWAFTVEIDGEDLVVNGTTGTWFGGGNDSGDDGETSSGVMNDGRDPNLLGCALPVEWFSHSTYDSPFIPTPHAQRRIPSIPWHTPVVVTHGTAQITVALIDNGPAKSVRRGIDLTAPAFRALGGNLESGVMMVSYRIPGAAGYLS